MLSLIKLEIKCLSYRCSLLRKMSKQQHEEQSVLQRELCLLKEELRNYHLAYAFIRGVPYRVLESSCDNYPSWEAVKQVICKYQPEENKSFNLINDDAVFYVKQNLNPKLLREFEKWIKYP